MKTLNILRGLIKMGEVVGDHEGAVLDTESTKFYLYSYLDVAENKLHLELARKQGQNLIPLEVTSEDKTFMQLFLEKFVVERPQEQENDPFSPIDPFKLYAVSNESFITL